jgi:predicted RNA-binding Zn ribbon-like protein
MNDNAQKPWAQRMLFVSDRISLDLAHTGGPGPYKKFERLHSTEDLSTWLAICQLALLDCKTTSADLKRAYALRWAIWKAANALRIGEAPAAEDIEVINRLASASPLIPKYSFDSNSLTWKHPATARAALSTIARDAISVLSDHYTKPVQQCANPNCPLLFVDNSHTGKRRWCSMERCGTIMKVAKYRQNKK